MRVLMLLLGSLMASAALAGSDGIDVLEGFYQRVETLSATFEQVQLAENGDVLQQSSGVFLLARPDRFRWVYKQPYKQIIVSDGETFSFYDVGLSQVTVRDVSKSLRATPAQLLAGGTGLANVFEITLEGARDGLVWIKLVPRAEHSDFRSIRLALKQHVPAIMVLHDKLGQTTRITFDNVTINSPLPKQRFQLDIPDGVTVVDGRQSS